MPRRTLPKVGDLWSYTCLSNPRAIAGINTETQRVLVVDSLGRRSHMMLGDSGTLIYRPRNPYPCHALLQGQTRCPKPAVILAPRSGVVSCPNHASPNCQLEYRGVRTEQGGVFATCFLCPDCPDPPESEFWSEIVLSRTSSQNYELICSWCRRIYQLVNYHLLFVRHSPLDPGLAETQPFQSPSHLRSKPSRLKKTPEPQPPVTLADWLTTDWEPGACDA